MSDDQTQETYIRLLDINNRLTEEAIRNAIRHLNCKQDEEILDIPCGISRHAIWIAEENQHLRVTGVDYSKEFIEIAAEQAEKSAATSTIAFQTGDINTITFQDNSFDRIWCCDGLYPGPKETGCLVTEPFSVLKEFQRITRPEGTVSILFWSGNKFLPGYPFVEAALNSTMQANIPMQRDTDPEMHIMRASAWLTKTGFTDIEIKTFAADIPAPESMEEKEDLIQMFNMFWEHTEEEVDSDVWKKYQSLIDPYSADFILNKPCYTGFITYTMVTGKIPAIRIPSE